VGPILLKKIDQELENRSFQVFSDFSPNENGASGYIPFAPLLSGNVQPGCTSLQNITQNEIAEPQQRPTARLGCRFVCTTSGFAQKKDTKPVGGRGISGFLHVFFMP
jgi:hypothetical protein